MNFLSEVFEGFFITILITILVTIFITEILLRKRAPGFVRAIAADQSEHKGFCAGKIKSQRRKKTSLKTTNSCRGRFMSQYVIFYLVRRI